MEAEKNESFWFLIFFLMFVIKILSNVHLLLPSAAAQSDAVICKWWSTSLIKSHINNQKQTSFFLKHERINPDGKVTQTASRVHADFLCLHVLTTSTCSLLESDAMCFLIVCHNRKKTSSKMITQWLYMQARCKRIHFLMLRLQEPNIVYLVKPIKLTDCSVLSPLLLSPLQLR